MDPYVRRLPLHPDENDHGGRDQDDQDRSLVWHSPHLSALVSSTEGIGMQLPLALSNASYADHWWLDRFPGAWSTGEDANPGNDNREACAGRGRGELSRRRNCGSRYLGSQAISMRVPRAVPQWEAIANILVYEMKWHKIVSVIVVCAALLLVRGGTTAGSHQQQQQQQRHHAEEGGQGQGQGKLPLARVLWFPFVLIVRHLVLQITYMVYALTVQPYAVHHRDGDPEHVVLPPGPPDPAGDADLVQGPVQVNVGTTLAHLSLRRLLSASCSFWFLRSIVVLALSVVLGGRPLLAAACYELVPLVVCGFGVGFGFGFGGVRGGVRAARKDEEDEQDGGDARVPCVLERRHHERDSDLHRAVPPLALVLWYHTLPRVLLAYSVDSYLLESLWWAHGIDPLVFVTCAAASDHLCCTREVAVRIRRWGPGPGPWQQEEEEEE